jgi:hypothetical protein
LGLELSEVVGRLESLARFAVEPLAGDFPSESYAASGRLVGDRIFELVDAETQEVLTIARHPELARWEARYSEPLLEKDFATWARIRSPSGREYRLGDPAWLSEIAVSIGRAVHLRTIQGEPGIHGISRPTVGLLERTYGASLGPSLLRANLLIEITYGRAFEEESWVGRRVRVGGALFESVATSQSCLSIGGAAADRAGDRDLLAGLLQVRGGRIGIALRAESGQRLRIGDPVVLPD